MILGLDISSSITGIAVIDNGKLIHSEMCDTRNKKKYGHIYDAGQKFKGILEDIKANYDITDIYAEERLLAFMKQRTSAKTLATLAEYNALYCYLAEEIFGIRPEKIYATTARTVTEVKEFKDSEKETKQWVLEAVQSKLSSFSFDLTRYGNPKPGTYDRADAAVIALAGEILCNEEDSES